VSGWQWCVKLVRVCWVFFTVFSFCFLNKNVFSLDLLLVVICGVKFNSFS
jgi:hypothetical protein